MRIAIVGAGLTGLTAAYRLSQKNHQVVVFEKENCAGGLATGFKKRSWNWYLENFFHHLFISDAAAKTLLSELELSDKLFYTRPKTSIFYKGKSFQFDSPLVVLRFSHLNPLEKLRTGFTTAYLRLDNNWKKFEKTTAVNWLSKHYGQKTFRILWEPLLKAKFSRESQKISMSWFWARIKKRSANLGYIEGGFQIIINKLAREIKKSGGKILLKREVKKLNNIYHYSHFDRVIITTPVSVFLKIAPNLPENYKLRLQKLKMVASLNLVLTLKEKFLTDNTYWLNINEPSFPFVAVVEHTNFVNLSHYGGDHILYVGGYYPQNHRYFKMNQKEIFNEFLPYLKKINPKFNQLSAISYQLSANLFAQPIIPTNYSKLIPSFKTPLPNVFLANMQMVYPWDRGVNYAIDLGQKVAKLICS